jgi:hypothetical protein
VKIYAPSYQEKSKDRMKLSFHQKLQVPVLCSPYLPDNSNSLELLGIMRTIKQVSHFWSRSQHVKTSQEFSSGSWIFLELQKLCMSHGRRCLQLMKAPSMQGGAFKYKEKTLECFTLSDKLTTGFLCM